MHSNMSTKTVFGCSLRKHRSGNQTALTKSIHAHQNEIILTFTLQQSSHLHESQKRPKPKPLVLVAGHKIRVTGKQKKAARTED